MFMPVKSKQMLVKCTVPFIIIKIKLQKYFKKSTFKFIVSKHNKTTTIFYPEKITIFTNFTIIDLTHKPWYNKLHLILDKTNGNW
jgi:hypothetical protein